MDKTYPSKLYYSISEVAEITGIKAHVLRYWESEFPSLKPKKTRNGSRRYRQADIEEVEAIRRLLYDEGFKIAGARKQRKVERQQAKAQQTGQRPQLALGFNALSDTERLTLVQGELKSVLEMIRDLKIGAAEPKKAKGKKMEAKG